MNGFLPLVIECLSLLAIFAVAYAITLPLRRAMSDHEHPERGVLLGLKNLVGHISRPLAVLLITELLLGVFSLVLRRSARHFRDPRSHQGLAVLLGDCC